MNANWNQTGTEQRLQSDSRLHLFQPHHAKVSACDKKMGPMVLLPADVDSFGRGQERLLRSFLAMTAKGMLHWVVRFLSPHLANTISK